MEFSLAQIIGAVAGFLVVFYFKELNSSVKEVVKSVQELNVKVGAIVERTENHTLEIEILRNKQDNLQSDVAHIKAHIARDNENA